MHKLDITYSSKSVHVIDRDAAASGRTDAAAAHLRDVLQAVAQQTELDKHPPSSC
jgi:hypothetical protein